MVFLGFVTIWSFATPPTRYSPFAESATTLGRTRLPLSVGTTRGMRFRTCATQVLVVPRSMPRMGFSRADEAGMGLRFYHDRFDQPSRAGLERHVVTAVPTLAHLGYALLSRLAEQGRNDARALGRRLRGEERWIVRRGEREAGTGLVELPPLVEDRVARELLHEARRLQHHPLAVARRGHDGEAQVELVPGAGAGDVEEAPLLLLAVAVAERLRAREAAVGEPNQEHRPPLQPLRLVDGGEHHLLVGLAALGDGLAGELGEERDLGQERLHVLVAAGILGELAQVLQAGIGVHELGLEVLLVALRKDELDRLARQIGGGRAGELAQQVDQTPVAGAP